MKMISYIQHLHKAIFIVLLILALTACEDPGGGGGPGGGGPGGNQTIEWRYPSDSSEQIRTYAEGKNGNQRYKAFSFEIIAGLRIHGSDERLPSMLRRFSRDNIYTDQLEEEEVVLGNAMNASEAQKEVLRNLTMATFPLGLFTEDNMRSTLTSASRMNLNQQLKLLYNEATGEVKFSIKVEERPLVGNSDFIEHPDFLPDEDPRRWSKEEIAAERYQIKRANGSVEENIPNAVYRLAIRQDRTDEILVDPLKAVSINLVFPEPVMIGADERLWYFIGELHKDPQCTFGSFVLEASPKIEGTNCVANIP